MAWVRFDDKRALNKKLRKAGLEARGLDEAAICWAAHEETDGWISREDLEMLAGAHGCKNWRRLVEILIKVGRWECHVAPGVAGWWIHDFLEYNPSSTDLSAERTKREQERVAARERMRLVRANGTGREENSS